MLSLATLSAVCILACTLFEAWLFTFLQASNILQARWWEDVDFLQFTETFCQGGNHVKASKWSACTYMHQLVHQRVYIYFTLLHQLWARAYMCINFFFNPYFPAEGSCLGNFLENNDASSIFCKSADEKESSCSPKNTNITLVLQSTQSILSPSWRETTFQINFHHAEPSLSNQREFSHRWWG